jgi:hypothetical protein
VDEVLTTFEQLVSPVTPGELNRLGKPREDVRDNPKVRALVGGLYDTTVILMRAPGFETLLEGTHRLAAVAVEAASGSRSNFKLQVHVVDFGETERPLLEKFAQDRQAIIKLTSDSRLKS